MPVIGSPGALGSRARGWHHRRCSCPVRAAQQRVVDDVLARRNIDPCRRLIVSRASALRCQDWRVLAPPGTSSGDLMRMDSR
jgi:hypothetical protein